MGIAHTWSAGRGEVILRRLACTIGRKSRRQMHECCEFGILLRGKEPAGCKISGVMQEMARAESFLL